jgi:ferredoxin
MPIPTSRTKQKGEIKFISENCTGCGLCVKVCMDFNIKIVNKKAEHSNDTSIFGCIACGHCMAVCPSSAIEIYGRETSPTDLFELPDKNSISNYEQVLNLLKRRRCIREFKEIPVPQDIIDKILNAALTAPMGLPPSDVNVLIFDSKEKVQTFALEVAKYFENLKWMVSYFFLTIMRPFWGKSNDEMFRGFIKPLFKIYSQYKKNERNLINYDAPLAIYFYGSPYTDPADPIIAATYAMIAAESLGLGTCMLGGVHPFIQSGKKAEKFRKQNQIKYQSKEGLFVIFGYTAIKYQKGITRTFASVEYYK